MRQKKWWILLLTAAILALAVLGGIREAEGDLSVRAVVGTGETEEQIRLWISADDRGYVFLPGYASLEDVRLWVGRSGIYRIDGQPVKNGMTCGGFSLNTHYPVEVLSDEAEEFDSITFVRSANLETAFLDTASGTMEHLHEAKENKENGALRLYSIDGARLYAGELMKISGRGHSSWGQEKKSYSIALRTPADLLGMGTAENWILQANAMDGTNLRNKLVFDFARDAGMAYAPESRWVDVYLNGEYAGVYLLCERNEIHPERLDISRENSFLVSKDWRWRLEDDGRPFVMTQAQVALRIHESDLTEASLLDILQSAENAILAPGGADTTTGKSWQELIDIDSWVKKYLVEEIFGNADGTTLSQYYYYNGNTGMLYAGPVWDYDLSMGNPFAIPENGTDMFFANKKEMYGSPWVATLYQNEAFYQEVREGYGSLRPLLEEYLNTILPDYARLLEQAGAMNLLRWPVGGLTGDIDFLRAYMTRRMAFLDSLWLEEQPYCTVSVQDRDGNLHCYAVAPGDPFPNLSHQEKNTDMRRYVWCDRETGKPVDLTAPVTGDIWLLLKSVPKETPSQTTESTQLQETATPETEPPAPQEQREEPSEPMSLLRLGPLLLFLGMLALLAITGLRRNRDIR